MLKVLINLWWTDFNSSLSKLINRGRNRENVAGSKWAPLMVRVRRLERGAYVSSLR